MPPPSRLARIREGVRGAFRATYRYARRFAVAIGVVVAVLLVSTITIDLGPALRARAEREGTRWFERKLTIGRLGVHLARGRFVIEDLQIDGMQPGEPPWLVAKRLDVSLTWRALFGREVLLDSIEMTDWRMVVESFPDGRQTFPRLTGPPRAPRQGPGLVVTTLQYVHAHRGELVVNDYGSDWYMVAPNVDVTVSKAGQYRGQMRFNDGTIRIQKYVPMSADLVASFKMDSGKLVFDRIDLETDGAVSTMSGFVDMAKWPEQRYQVKSHIQFPIMRELFFANDKFSLFGEGDFTGTFHLFKGGHDLKGSFASEIAGVTAAKASWTAAEKALAAYQATTLQITNPPPVGP